MADWLVKSEPDAFSLDDLAACPDGTDHWDGVRNYQARNFMRDDMQPGDRVLFYHSNCAEPAVVGIAEVASEAYPDHTAFDPDSPYFDPKSDPDEPRWLMVDIRYKTHLPRPVTLKELKADADAFEGLLLIRRGNRLSVMPVEPDHFDAIVQRAQQEPSET